MYFHTWCLRITTAMMKHHDQSHWGKKGFISLILQHYHFHLKKSEQELKQDSDLDTGVEVEAMEGYCLLDCLLVACLSLFSYRTQNSQALDSLLPQFGFHCSEETPMLWQLIWRNTFNSDLPTAYSWIIMAWSMGACTRHGIGGAKSSSIFWSEGIRKELGHTGIPWADMTSQPNSTVTHFLYQSHTS